MTDERIFRPILNDLEVSLTEKNYRDLHSLPRFVFLCGEDIKKGQNRPLIKDFFQRINRSEIYCIDAESLFVRGELDLLTFEENLALVSDAIVLVLESFGVACELGAFATKKSLVKKMVVFSDDEHEGKETFINEGPLKKVRSYSDSNVIFVDLNALLSKTEVSKKLREIALKKRCYINKNENKVEVKAFLLEILELIALLGPLTKNELIWVYKELKNFKKFFNLYDKENKRVSRIKISFLLDLLTSACLVIQKNDFYFINGERYTYEPFMFELSPRQFNSLRLKILARQYRYRGGVVNDTIRSYG